MQLEISRNSQRHQSTCRSQLIISNQNFKQVETVEQQVSAANEIIIDLNIEVNGLSIMASKIYRENKELQNNINKLKREMEEAKDRCSKIEN